MELPVASPSNRFLTPQRDRRWPQVLSAVLLVSGAMLVVLFLVGWPRLKSTSIHYELIRLRAEVEALERQEHGLLVELERERNPARLGEQARGLGLEPLAPTDLSTTEDFGGSP